MNKAQHLYDYLIKTELVTEEELDIWIEEGEVLSAAVFDGRNGMEQPIVYVDKYQIHLWIKDFPSTKRDSRKIKIAIIWWLNHYQPDRKNTAFGWEVDNLNSKTTNIWIGIPIEEKTIMKEGKITSCNEAFTFNDYDLSGTLVFLRDTDTGEETLLDTTDE